VKESAFVLDSSIALAWCFSDERTAATDALFERYIVSSAVIPDIIMLELTNVLSHSEKKGCISQADAQEFMARFLAGKPEFVPSGPEYFDQLFPLCKAHGLTAYDAAYLWLAQHRNLPLATKDIDLMKAARTVQIKCLIG
jgi:predicted nucleic acid-binding protein